MTAAETVRYAPPNTSDEYRAEAQECLDRAQRALEVAELNLDTVAEVLNRITVAPSMSDLIAHGEARTRLGRAWADLASAKYMGGLR